MDIVSALNGAGIPSTRIPSKIEGVTFGQDVTYQGKLEHTVWIANDNDFVPATSGPNQYYVFGFSDGDLPGFVAEQIAAVPEASTWAMLILGFAALAWMARGKRKHTCEIA